MSLRRYTRNTTSGSGSEDVVEGTGFGDISSYPVGDSSVATSKFIAVPTHGNDILIAKRSSATPSSGTPTNFYYGVRATTAKPSGLYKNTITYTAIGDGSVAGLASVSPSRTNQLAGGQILTIATPSTATVESAGAATVTVGGQACTNTAVMNNDGGTGIYLNVTCTSPALATGWHEVVVTFAGSGETYVVNPGIEYYADEGTIAGTMQGFTKAQCDSMNTGQTIILSDIRDSKTYNVAKLADGLCRMTSNLRLGDPNQDITLTSANSDLLAGSSDFVLPASAVQASGSDPWSGTVDAPHIYQQSSTEYGNLYNWYTATAGTGTSSTAANVDATSSICPKGWKLPPNTGAGSYKGLTDAASIDDSSAGSTKIRSAPYSFPYAGYYSGGLGYQGSYGYYWSRTAYSGTDAYSLGFLSSGVSPQNSNLKYSGRSVRCYYQPTPQETAIEAINSDNTSGTLDLSAILTMQQFDNSVCTAMKTSTADLNPNKNYTLKDSRDNKTYNVAKLDDGRCRMVQNLRLGSDSQIKLTIDDTDLASTDVYDSGQDGWYTPAVQTSGTTSWGSSSSPDSKHIYQQSSTEYGDLYNWYTATAGTGTYSLSSGDASSSICPKGWKLPPNTGTGSYVNLITAASISGSAGSTKIRSAPYSFPHAGGYSSELGLGSQGSYGDYWSRTAYSSTVAYDLGFGSSSVYPQNNNYKYYGSSVRCVYDTDDADRAAAISIISSDTTSGALDLSNTLTMQQFDTSVCNAMSTSTASSNPNKKYILTDSRDGKTYSVAKLDDGVCRMTQNLRLGSSSTIRLTVYDTDLASTDIYDSGQDGWYTPAVQTSGNTSWADPVDDKHIYQQSSTEYGNLYNWYTTTAGTGLASMSSGDASSSICPKGWKLPPNTGAGSYKGLTDAASIGNNSAGSTKIRSAPYSFPYAGYYDGGLGNQGSHSSYWSRTANSGTYAYYLVFYSSSVNPQGYSYKYVGRSVRCYYSG